MGFGVWSASSYAATTGVKMTSGKTFGYTNRARSMGVQKPHETLDPLVTAKNGFIESRDNDDHPNSVPIILGMDQTGSMGSIPRTVQKKLTGIFDLLMLRGYIEDPQIAITAYGDAYSDPVRTSVQFSNFESDNRIDEALDNLLLWGGGGGNGGETMTGIWYMMNKVRSDAWEKRNKKGYAFFVADEIALDLLPQHVAEFAGDEQPVGPIDVKGLAQSIQEKWDVYILLIDNAAANMQGSEAFYKKLFGKRKVLVLEDTESVAETIALAIGVNEGTVDLDEAEDDLRSTGSNEVAIQNSTKAIRLAGLGSGGKVAQVNASIDFKDDGVDRL